MSSTLHDLVIEILNQSKLADDGKSKLFKLEQIKEIILYRDSTLLPLVINDIMDFMTERAPSIRRFLVFLFGDAIRKNNSLWMKAVTLFNYLMSDTPADLVLKALTIEMTKLYATFIRSIANLPQKTAYTTHNTDPKELWNQIRSICSTLLDLITSSKNEEIRVRCIKFAEVIVLFGTVKDNQQIHSNAYNVADISLHNSHIDRNIVQSDADTLLGKMALWARRGGPQENPFQLSELIQLGTSISRVAIERPTSRKISILALSFLLSDLKRVAAVSSATTLTSTTDKLSMASVTDLKSTLVEAAMRVLDKVDDNNCQTQTVDVKASVAKLREALQVVRNSETTDDEEDANKEKKRKFLSISVGDSGDASAVTVLEEFPITEGGRDEQESLEEVEGDSESFHDSVIAAVDSAHSYLQLQRKGPRSGSADDSADPTAVVGGTTGRGEVLELGSDLMGFPNHLASVVLATVSQQQQQQKGINEMAVTYIPPQTELLYSDMSMDSLHRILEGILDCKKKGIQTGLAGRVQLAVRLVLSLSMAEVFSLRALTDVIIVAKSGPDGSNLPPYVPLPRPLWLFVCFALGGGASRALSKADKDLLTTMSSTLYQASNSSGSRTSSALDASTFMNWAAVYEEYCLAILSRVVQRRDLRYFSKDVLRIFPYFPHSCLRLLSGIMRHGSLPPAATNPSADRDRGTRAVGLSVLANICTTASDEEDVDSFEETISEALNFLLAAALSEDFGTRSKVISVLVEELMSKAPEPVRNRILTFARQSCIALLGGPAAYTELCISESNLSSTAIEDTSMEAMVTDTPVKAPVPENNIQSALAEYDDGETYGVSFSGLLGAIGHQDAVISAGSSLLEGQVRRQLQLLLQLGLRQPVVLADLLTTYVVASKCMDVSAPSGVGELFTVAGESTAVTVEGAGGSTTVTSENVTMYPFAPVVVKLLRTEILTLLSAMTRHSPAKILASMFAVPNAVKEQREARGILADAIDTLLIDPSHPPSVEVVQFVKSFVRSPTLLLEPLSVGPDVPAPAFDNSDIRLCSCIAGGLESEEVMALLPKLIADSSQDSSSISDTDRLRKTFNRIVQARPPPLSASELLVALHRLDQSGAIIKPKLVLEAIGVCLSDKQIFNAEAIIEALEALLGDRPLSLFFYAHCYPFCTIFYRNKKIRTN